MTKSVYVAAILLGMSLTTNGCTPEAETDRQSEKEESAREAKDAAKQSLAEARRNAEAAAN